MARRGVWVEDGSDGEASMELLVFRRGRGRREILVLVAEV